jgi:hypothetical protein
LILGLCWVDDMWVAVYIHLPLETKDLIASVV